jgi:hypothetical protein
MAPKSGAALPKRKDQEAVSKSPAMIDSSFAHPEATTKIILVFCFEISACDICFR